MISLAWKQLMLTALVISGQQMNSTMQRFRQSKTWFCMIWSDPTPLRHEFLSVWLEKQKDPILSLYLFECHRYQPWIPRPPQLWFLKGYFREEMRSWPHLHPCEGTLQGVFPWQLLARTGDKHCPPRRLQFIRVQIHSRGKTHRKPWTLNMRVSSMFPLTLT